MHPPPLAPFGRAVLCDCCVTGRDRGRTTCSFRHSVERSRLRNGPRRITKIRSAIWKTSARLWLIRRRRGRASFQFQDSARGPVWSVRHSPAASVGSSSITTSVAECQRAGDSDLLALARRDRSTSLRSWDGDRRVWTGSSAVSCSILTLRVAANFPDPRRVQLTSENRLSTTSRLFAERQILVTGPRSPSATASWVC